MERELKYGVRDAALFNELRGLTTLAGYPLTAAGVEEQQNTYYDTAEATLRQRAYSLRVRQLGERSVLTLKWDRSVQNGFHEREELEAELGDGGLASGWPDGALGEKLGGLLGGTPQLTPLFTITTTREKLLVGPLDQPVAELALDSCVLLAGGRTQGFHEVEVELLDAQAEAGLQAIGAELRERWRLEPEARSKFERGLDLLDAAEAETKAPPAEVAERLEQLAAKHEPNGVAAVTEQLAELAESQEGDEALLLGAEKPRKKKRRPEFRISPEDEVAEAARKLLGQQLRKLRKHEQEARANEDPEGVHQMRVVTRRMRAILAATKGAFKPKALAPFAPMLRELAGDLGAVRDRDVFLEHLQAYLASQDEGTRADLAALEGQLHEEQGRAHTALIKLLDSKKWAKAEAALEAFVESPGKGRVAPKVPEHEVAAVQVRHRTGSAILSRYEELRAYEAVLPDVPVETLHRMRIAGKRLRYTLELFEELLDSARYREVRSRLMELQDHLGALQDAEVSMAYLHAFEDTAPSPGLDRYIATREQEHAALLEGFPKVWARVNSLTFRRRLTDVINQL
jgi:inorganic triphosphatase YgiF